MARLTDGVRLPALRSVARGKWAGRARVVPVVPELGRGGLWQRARAKVCGVVPVIGRGAGLRLGGRARVQAVAPGIGLAVVFRAVPKARGGAVGSGVGAAAWRSAVPAAVLSGIAAARGGACLHLITPMPAAALALAPWMSVGGPGESAGESVYALPAQWAGQVLPAAYLGESLAVLALVRGESWAFVEGALRVAGRVVLDQYGLPLVIDETRVERWRVSRLDDAEKMLGMIWMAAGSVRDALLSERRQAVEALVRKRAKSIAGVADAAARAALVADMDFLQRAV